MPPHRIGASIPTRSVNLVLIFDMARTDGSQVSYFPISIAELSQKVPILARVPIQNPTIEYPVIALSNNTDLFVKSSSSDCFRIPVPSSGNSEIGKSKLTFETIGTSEYFLIIVFEYS